MAKTSNGQKTNHEIMTFIYESLWIAKDDYISIQKISDVAIENKNMLIFMELKHSKTTVSSDEFLRGISQLYYDHLTLKEQDIDLIPILRFAPRATFMGDEVKDASQFSSNIIFEKIRERSNSNKKIKSIDDELKFNDFFAKICFIIDHYKKTPDEIKGKKTQIIDSISRKYNIEAMLAEIIYLYVFDEIYLEEDVCWSGEVIQKRNILTIIWSSLTFEQFKIFRPDSKLTENDFKDQIGKFKKNSIEYGTNIIDKDINEYVSEKMIREGLNE